MKVIPAGREKQEEELAETKVTPSGVLIYLLSMWMRFWGPDRPNGTSGGSHVEKRVEILFCVSVLASHWWCFLMCNVLLP